MKNPDTWQPSKFVYRNGRLAASRDRAEVGPQSLLIADLVAELYGTHLPRHARGRLLDLGCGKVPLFAAYRHHVTDVTCADWEHTTHRNDHLDLECDLTRPLPFADGEFDTVVLSDVLEHIPEPALLWQEMTRILAAQGKIVMNVPFYYWLHEHPHDYYRYTEFALRRFVSGSGLALIELQAVGGAPEIMADIFAKTAVRLPAVGRMLAVLAQRTAWLFVKTRFGQKVSRSTGRDFPFGYFLVAQKPHPVN